MPRKKVRPPWVDARSLSLEQWLQYVLLPEDEQPEAFENFRFATRTLREQFIATIGDRTDQEIRVILRQFLLMGGNLGADGRRLLDYASQPDIKELLEEREYVRRLFNQKRHTWEGMSWIIDLLPRFSAEAVEAISAYDLAHFFILPDGRVHGLADAIDVIRAKYLEAITEENLAGTVSPRDFEYMVAAYYSHLDYKVRVTKQTRDGGHDIVATRESKSAVERLLVECKCTTVPIPVTTIRQLGGVLGEFTATGGVLVTTSRFTAPGYHYAKRTARIQLIDHAELCKRFNSVFGPNWTSEAPRIIRQGMVAAATNRKGT